MKLEEYLLQHYSPRSVRRFSNRIGHFKSHYGTVADRASYTDIVEYIGQLRSQNLHPKSLRNHLFSIKIYFRYLVAIGQRKDHPCEALNLKDQINRAIIVESLYSKEELEELYQNYKTPTDKRKGKHKSEATEKRDKIIIGLLVYQALTSLEVMELSVHDIDLKEGTINIKDNNHTRRRGNKGRVLGLKSKQILPFQEYLKKFRKEFWSRQKPRKRKDYFILNESGLQMWGTLPNRLLSEQKITSPFKIRQSVIANLLKSGVDTRLVQEFAGHRRAGSTEAYKRTGLEELKIAIEKLHPRQ